MRVGLERTGLFFTAADPIGVTSEAIAGEMEIGRLFGDNEQKTRRVVETSLYDPSRFVFRSRVPESQAFTARVELLGSIRPGRVSYGEQGEVAVIQPADA